MTRLGYVHGVIPELSTLMTPASFVETRGVPELDLSYLTNVAVAALRIGRRIGIATPSRPVDMALPYSSTNDQVVFEAPQLGKLIDRDVAFLRGWSMFESCIKGYNALGLMAEQVIPRQRVLATSDATEVAGICRRFLSTRRVGGELVFSSEEAEAWEDEEVLTLDLLDVAIWQTFADVRIVCSTSSNMGLSLHDALRALQHTHVVFAGREVSVLNDNEGLLTIWCPDERADFMNHEKSAFLRGLELQEPHLTTLRTYINRQERDPGALGEALDGGGYFFPTNPQSPDELQALLYHALLKKATNAETTVAELLDDAGVRSTLASLGCTIEGTRIVVERGVEGGLGGLMLPYFLLAEEACALSGPRAMSVWNQASIGAALASAVLADQALRAGSHLSEEARYALDSAFPTARQAFAGRSSDSPIATRIHGVFDLANIQSLAQLLGVVVPRHLSGKGTAFVGLGSASYSNGNRCFEILSADADRLGPFRGRGNFHPATHALNLIAQALVYGEDVARVRHFADVTQVDLVSLVARHCRKPEPAGAAAVTGYLLTRLDRGSLSSVQIAFTLRALGFDRDLLLDFAGYPLGAEGEQAFVRSAEEEGQPMRHLAVELMTLLEWPTTLLHQRVNSEAAISRRSDFLDPIDPSAFEALDPLVVLYLTGDNTFQPGVDFIGALVHNQERHSDLLAGSRRARTDSRNDSLRRIRRVDAALQRVEHSVSVAESSFQMLRRRVVSRLADRSQD